jgi:transcription initiation factor TFIIB
MGPATAAPATHHDECPECDGPVRKENHETVCTDCGLVIDDDQIDHGLDWRDIDTDPGTSERAASVLKRDGNGRQLLGLVGPCRLETGTQ